jgi:hypothetical protein
MSWVGSDPSEPVPSLEMTEDLWKELQTRLGEGNQDEKVSGPAKYFTSSFSIQSFCLKLLTSERFDGE